MQDAWKPNDEKHEDEELTVTEHRDGPTPDQEVMSEGAEDPALEVPHRNEEEALEDFSEDVNSSPAERGRE